jgi:K+-sensing histidine kinase KdpD
MDRSAPEPLALRSVRDHGPGVLENCLDANLSAILRIHGDADATGANGLGLAIAAEAIRLLRGQICDVNLLPTGLEINIQLPVAYDLIVHGVRAHDARA